MQRHDNPFHDLWLTEILTADEFVRMFSPQVVKNAQELFATGNVVVRGTQGSGKSMLLSLLNTRTRIAYESSGEPYPGPTDRPFISAGVHLIRAGASKVSARLAEQSDSRREMWAATTFGDYINYCLLEDLLENVVLLAEAQGNGAGLKKEIPLNWSGAAQSKFVERLARNDVWFGYFENCQSIEDVRMAISSRLRNYRSYFNFNRELDKTIEQSKTAMAQPLLVVADCLRLAGVVPESTLFFLRIDQHEELFALEQTTGFGNVFRQVINSALSSRDGRVSFRIGTRHYSWGDDVRIWGSGAKLENMRDYVVVDLDETFRRKENSRSAIAFDNFAEDVFRRRLESTDFRSPAGKHGDILEFVFGKTPSASERARNLGSASKPLLTIPKDWDSEWKEDLFNLWREGARLEAKLGEVWLRQSAQQIAGVHLDRSSVEGFPWLERTWWVKERNEAALVQIAGAATESLYWCGRRHIVDLAGFNILAFMSICRSIWAAWLRYVDDDVLLKIDTPPQISPTEQSIGVVEASRLWFDKLREGLDGDQRTTFITALGTWFARGIRSDKALSNPGHNGISLTQKEFSRDSLVTKLIKSSRDQGDFIEAAHTTKSGDRAPRIKWYLHPLLCPYFRIPFVRTKEPIYTSIEELEILFQRQQSGDQPTVKRQRVPNQASLFEE